MTEGRTVPDKANVDDDDPCDAQDRGGKSPPFTFRVPAPGVFH